MNFPDKKVGNTWLQVITYARKTRFEGEVGAWKHKSSTNQFILFYTI